MISDERGSGQGRDPVCHQDRGNVHAISDEVGDGKAQAIGAPFAGFPSGRLGLLHAGCAEASGCVR